VQDQKCCRTFRLLQNNIGQGVPLERGLKAPNPPNHSPFAVAAIAAFVYVCRSHLPQDKLLNKFIKIIPQPVASRSRHGNRSIPVGCSSAAHVHVAAIKWQPTVAGILQDASVLARSPKEDAA